MNENKRLMIIGIIIILIIAIVPISAIITNTRSEKLLEEVREYVKEENSVIYIGRDNCSYCVMFEPEIKLVKEYTDLEYLYVDTNKLKASHLEQLLEELEIAEEDFGTPYLVITNEEKIVSQHAGYMSEDQLLEYLKETEVIEKEATLPLNYINYETYTKMISSNEKQLIVIAQSGCPSCEKAKPIFYELAQEYDVKINYLNASNIATEDAEGFPESLEYFVENGISTPTVLIVSNKKVIDSLEGVTTLENYVEFLEKNSFIKE